MKINLSLNRICSIIKEDGRIPIVQNIELDPTGEHDVGVILIAHTESHMDIECLLYENSLYLLSPIDCGTYVFGNKIVCNDSIKLEKIIEEMTIAAAKWLDNGSETYIIDVD